MNNIRDIDALKNPFSGKNWEKNVRQVCIEPCDEREDPLGCKALFFISDERDHGGKTGRFEVGASFLVQRKQNLSKAGYDAPMTHRAIDLIEQRIGSRLSGFLF